MALQSINNVNEIQQTHLIRCANSLLVLNFEAFLLDSVLYLQ